MYLIPNLMTRGDRETPHPFLSDVNVRRALRMAIDVDTIIETTFLGYGVPQWTDLFRSPWDGCEIPRPVFDPVAAAALLEGAGWTDTDGDGVRECNGCTTAEEGYVMNMEFAIYAEYGLSLELAQQLIAENWLDIGLSTDLEIIEGSVMWAAAEEGGLEENGEFEMDMWDDGYPGLDASDYLWTYYYSESEWNYGRYANEDADYYIDELYTLYDEDRLWAGCELAKILDADVPWINLFSTLEQHGVSTRLKGVLPSANDPVTWNVADWTLDE
jgi:peptide/nickel transport system substrate-binding protein